MSIAVRDPAVAAAAARDPSAAGFALDGFLGPVRLYSPEECRAILSYIRNGFHPAPADWRKGRAVTDRTFFELAADPKLLSLLKPLLGDDIILWGSSVVERKPGSSHPWHTDIESAAPQGGFVSVWIGLENTAQDTALQLISRSHAFGKPVQQEVSERGLRRGMASADEVLGWAREHDPAAETKRLEVRDGDAILFDGRIWHGSQSPRAEDCRLALLLQYASADTPVRMPDFRQLEWPFRFLKAPRPPILVVSGTSSGGTNRLVPPPPPTPERRPMISTLIEPLSLPLAEDPSGWRPYPVFRGPTRTVATMGCHASVLSPGHSPHPPHAHGEEELLMVLDGEAEIVITDGPDTAEARVETMCPGSFVYYPAHQHHTIRNVGARAVTYLMFKWRAGASRADRQLGVEVVHFGDVGSPGAVRPMRTHRLLEDATSYLGRLQAHLTELQPGGGYEPHVDAHDVAIVTLSGTVETLDQTVEPRSVIYYGAGELHGMKNTGDRPARYLVFEFHAPGLEKLSRGASHRRVPGQPKKPGRLWSRVSLLWSPRRVAAGVLRRLPNRFR